MTNKGLEMPTVFEYDFTTLWVKKCWEGKNVLPHIKVSI